MDKFYFQWHITDVCNFRCRHCYQDKFERSSELDWEGLKSVADRIAEAARSQNSKAVISITGGEPFLKKELFELLAYLDKQEELAQLIIITNGSLIDRRIIENLRGIKKLNQVKISLEGETAFSNDAVRGGGSFEKAIEAIGLIKEESDFSILIMFTAMKSNLKEARGLFGLCRRLRVDGLIVERFFPLGQGSKIKDELLGRQDWSGLVKDLLEITGEACDEEDVASWRAFWMKFSKTETELLGASCNVGRDAFCIMPNADVLPCRRFNLKIGNLLERPLSDIISSRLLTGIINSKRKGRCADCDISDCRGCPALSYLLTGDYLFEDFQCGYDFKRKSQGYYV